MASKIAPDKIKHFLVGIPLGLVLAWVPGFLFALPPVWDATLGFAALVAICYGFEIFSWVTGMGHGDHLDAIAGIVGGVLGLGMFWLGQHML